jgi:predicted amidohydrolase
MILKIGLAQMVCDKGAVEENLARTLQTLEEAEARGVDILAFPEASLTGYTDPNSGDGPPPYATQALSLDDPAVRRLIAQTRGKDVTALVGLVESNPGSLPFITQIVVRGGSLLGAYRKVTLPDDEDWYTPGSGVPVFTHRRVSGEALTFGIAICADIGNEEVYAQAARQGAQIVFEVAAPGLYGDQATRNWRSGYAWWEGECRSHLTAYARTYDIWIAVATQAGRTLDEDFPGGGYVFAPGGARLYATPNGSPGVVYLKLDLDARRVTEL